MSEEPEMARRRKPFDPQAAARAAIDYADRMEVGDDDPLSPYHRTLVGPIAVQLRVPVRDASEMVRCLRLVIGAAEGAICVLQTLTIAEPRRLISARAILAQCGMKLSGIMRLKRV